MLKKSLVLILALLSTPVFAQSEPSHSALWNSVPQNATNCKVGPCAAPYVGAPPLGFQQLTSLSAATSLTVPAGATEALIVCTGEPVMWRDDGVAPTASVGMFLGTATALPYTGNLTTIQIIQSQASSVCDISYYK